MYTSFWQIIRHRCVQPPSKQAVSVVPVVYDPKSVETLAALEPITTHADTELFLWQQKALQPNSVAGLERTGCAHCALCAVRDSAPCTRRAYADGRGPLETRMVIVAPAAALDGVWPTTFPVATLSS